MAEVTAPSVSASGRTTFESLPDIKAAHLGMMSAASAVKTSSLGRLPSTEDIQTFVAKVRETGKLIASVSERRAAQRILDHWSDELVARPGISRENFSAAPLEQFAGSGPGGEAESAPPTETVSKEIHLRSQQYIRIAAQARNWRDTRSPGYLLSGQALDDARAFHDDPDIEKLIRDSEQAQAGAAARRQRWMYVIVVGLVASLVVMAWLWREEKAQREIAIEETAQASARAEELDKLSKERETALDEANKLAAEADAARQAATGRLAELESKQRNLTAAIEVIVSALIEDKLTPAALQTDPENKEVLAAALAVIVQRLDAESLTMDELPPAVAALVKPPPKVTTNPFDRSLNGYDERFLDIDIPLPSLGEGRPSAFQGGRPQRYANYSLVINARWRMAFYSAANLDRQQRVVLPRAPSRFEFDPRIPQDVQPHPEWFSGDVFDRGHFVGRNDIAWGPLFAGERAAAARLLSQSIDVYTNVTPQFGEFNRTIWTDIETWVRTRHNPSATRVTIFTGPVFRTNQRVADWFWKVAVSAAPNLAQQAVTAPRLIVDAFLVRHDRQARFAKSDEAIETYKVPLSRIEQLTGLRFVGAMREADPLGLSEGAALAARVGELNSDVDQTRTQAVRDFSAALDGVLPDLPDGEQQKLAAVLVAMASEESMLKLSDRGRRDLLSVLSKVPVATWNQSAWTSLRSGARRAVGDLEIRASQKTTDIGAETREYLDLLRRNIGLTAPSSQTVFLQFAGMTRERAVFLSDQLKAIGWRIPGEERTEKAAGKNEVRYAPDSPADAAAAALLAADLTAAGRPCAAKAVRGIAPGTIEIWMSI